MKIIRPTPIGSAALTASSLPETDYPEWSSATTYADGAFCIRAVTHRCYQSIVAGNFNHVPEASPGQWLDAGPTNRWAMFDDRVGTSSTGTGSIAITMAPGAIDALGIVDTDAELVAVTMSVGGTPVYSRTQSTNVGGSAIDDWFLYFFEPIGKKTALTFLDLPVQSTGVIGVTLTGPDPAGPVSCGTLIVGRQLDIGTTEAGPQVGINDFSRKETDAFGVTSIVERAWAKRMTLRVQTATSRVDGLQRALASVRATAVLWIGEEGYDSLTIYGFYKEFSIDIAYTTVSYGSLTIEGLI